MELILWRHADAEPGGDDLARELTPKGRDQAARVAAWLRKQLPGDYSVLVSPAVRAQQTAEALKVKFQTEKKLAPGASVQTIVKAAGWPDHEGTVVLVGHQPDFGVAAAQLVAGARASWSIKKGGLWWLSNRERDEEAQVVVRAVVSPDLL